MTYELTDETQLVRLRLHSMNDINSIIDVMKTAETDLTTNEVYYIYDSSYKTPLEAYEAGADFYTVADGNYDILLPTGEYKVSAILEASNKDANFFKQVDLGTITTDSSGKGTLAGVAEGTYYIKNTKTKSGYRLANTTAMKVKIAGSVASDTDGYYKVEIEVPTATLLPITGGSGTIIYTALGLIIIVTSITVFTVYTKKQKQI